MSKLLTPQEVADKLSLHIQTVRRWTREGKLKGTKIVGVVRYREEDIEALTDPDTVPTTQSEASEAV